MAGRHAARCCVSGNLGAINTGSQGSTAPFAFLLVSVLFIEGSSPLAQAELLSRY